LRSAEVAQLIAITLVGEFLSLEIGGLLGISP
jgi:hypothetical protein